MNIKKIYEQTESYRNEKIKYYVSKYYKKVEALIDFQSRQGKFDAKIRLMPEEDFYFCKNDDAGFREGIAKQLMKKLEEEGFKCVPNYYYSFCEIRIEWDLRSTN